MFSIKYKIKDEDINYGGHVGNERALLFFQMVRINFFESLGLSELNIGDNIGVIQRNSFVEYNKELFLDDEITIQITDIQLEKNKFNIYYEVYNQENKLAINGSTLLLPFSYTEKKLKRVPSIFKEKVEELL
ncbi:MAG: thioesterase family protein [Fusobacterium sp.]|nr:thioesterase family protein [Fusobacterium sp.]